MSNIKETTSALGLYRLVIIRQGEAECESCLENTNEEIWVSRSDKAQAYMRILSDVIRKLLNIFCEGCHNFCGCVAKEE